MKQHKATGIVFIRRYFETHQELNEQAFIQALSQEDQATYRLCVFNQWLHLDQAVRIFEKAAHFIFPEDENRIETLSGLHVNDSAGGVYRVLFKFLKLFFF